MPKSKKIKKKRKFEIYFIGLLFILVDLLIYMSGERSAFFFINLSTVFIIILIKEYQKFRLTTFIIAIICVIALSLNSSKLISSVKLKLFLGGKLDEHDDINKIANNRIFFILNLLLY